MLHSMSAPLKKDGAGGSDDRVPKNLSQVIDERNKLTSSRYLQIAQKSCEERDVPNAYKCFVKYLENLEDPSTSAIKVQQQFKQTVVSLAAALEKCNESEELLKLYVQALNLFPCDQIILNKLGEHLLKMNLPDIARPYLEKAVACKRSLRADNNLMLCKWSQFPRWHFRMLNDVIRNSSYCKAIRRAVSQGFTHVVDVGAGCGLLSLVASENPHVHVTAIEENKVLAQMCERIMKENGRENVTVMNVYSTTLTQAPSRCNLLVAEVFDCALFGEGMLKTLLHAHNTLITDKQNFRIIPCGAKLYVAAISYKDSQSVRVESKVPVLGLDKMCIVQQDADPYEAEDLTLKKFTYVSEPVQVYQINFYDTIYLYNLIYDANYVQTIDILCLEDALLTSFAIWFELDLDEFVTITTDPRREDRAKCWEQGVCHLLHPIAVKEGQILKFQVYVYQDKVQFCQLLERSEAICKSCLYVPEEVVTFLNDTNLVVQIVKLAEKFQDPLLLRQFKDPSKPVMDTMTVSIFGLMLAVNMGWQFFTERDYRSDLYINFIVHILAVNNRHWSQMDLATIIFEPDIDLLTCSTKLHNCKVFLRDTVSIDGGLSIPAVTKGMLSVKFPDCLILPVKLVVNVVLIYSEFLQTSNVVHDENVFNFKIAQIMNEYSTREHPCLDSSFIYTEHSNPISFTVNDTINAEKTVVSLQVTKTGQVNGLYTWFDIHFHDEISYSTKNSTHFNKTCYLIDRRNVQLDERLQLIFQRELHCMKFSFEES
ncbi:protein arginine N-methyltransferase 9 [Dendroctonus ponderosae]|uniref:protein arginine N-methyltransferase 9 n=1 Tax=Dendroctonus ponderosae TaxID=77166 RepID=UPI002034C6C2|nr:protein arginine N-methyltransferase 9 [Dendroctonus ponderosae]